YLVAAHYGGRAADARSVLKRLAMAPPFVAVVVAVLVHPLPPPPTPPARPPPPSGCSTYFASQGRSSRCSWCLRWVCCSSRGGSRRQRFFRPWRSVAGRALPWERGSRSGWVSTAGSG